MVIPVKISVNPGGCEAQPLWSPAAGSALVGKVTLTTLKPSGQQAAVSARCFQATVRSLAVTWFEYSPFP